MKRILMASALGLSLFTWSALAEEMTGVITCSKCKKTSAAAADCAKKCIQSGVAPIFVSSDGKTYKIANPDKVGDNINVKVNVNGDVKDDTVTLESVEPAQA